jgi:hypothetical protein
MATDSRGGMIARINDILATRITMLVGTIWAFYAFALFGLTPVVWPAYEEQILYWSNFRQLIFLPAITVGTAVMSRGAQEQAQEGYDILKREFALLQETHDRLTAALQQVDSGMQELLRRSGEPASPSPPASPAQKQA